MKKRFTLNQKEFVEKALKEQSFHGSYASRLEQRRYWRQEYNRYREGVRNHLVSSYTLDVLGKDER